MLTAVVRIAKRVARVVLLAVVFVVAFGLAVLVALDSPRGRRAIASTTNERLDGLFRGKVHVTRIGHVGLDGVSGIDAEAIDPEGKTVIAVRGLAVAADVPVLLRGLTSERTTAEVSRLSFDSADVSLAKGPDGIVDIARTFTLAHPSAPSKDETKLSFFVRVNEVDVRNIHASGDPGAPIEGHVTRARGRVAIDESALSVSVTEIVADATEPLASQHFPAGAATIDGAFVMPLSNPGLVLATANVRGTCGAANVTAHGDMNATAVIAHASVPPTPPEAIAALPLGLVPTKPASVEADVHGDLARAVAFDVKLDEIDATGTLALAGTKRLVATATASHLDLHGIDGALPESDLSLVTSIDVDETKHGTYTLSSEPGRIGAATVPRVKGGGTITPTAIDGRFDVVDKGVSGVLTVKASPVDENAVIVAHATADTPDLAAISRLALPAHGRAHAVADARIDMKTRTITGSGTVTGNDVRVGSDSARSVDADAVVSGSLTAPRLQVKARAEDIVVRGTTYERAHATAEIAPGRTTAITDVDARVEHGREHVAIEARRIVVAPDGVRIEGSRVDGLGAPATASMEKGPRGTHVVLKSEGIDIARVAQLAGIVGAPPGKVAVDIDLITSAAGTTGYARARARDLDAGGVILDGHLDTRFEGREAIVDAAIDAGLARARVSGGKLWLAGSVLEPKTWQKASFDVDVAGSVDLAAAQKVAGGAPPGTDVSGAAGFDVHASRAPEQRIPAILAAVTTRSLVVKTTSRTIAGYDLSSTFAWDAFTSDLEASIAAWDANGVVALVDAKARADLEEPFADGKWMHHARTWPLFARVTVPERELTALPEIGAALEGFRGKVGGEVTLEGSIHEPIVKAILTATGVTDGRKATLPIHATVTGDYDGRHAEVHAEAFEGAKKIMYGLGTIVVKATDALEDAPIAWSGAGDVTFDDLALAHVPGLHGVKGTLDGTVKLTGLHEDAALDVDATIAGLTYKRATIDQTHVSGKLAGGKLVATLETQAKDGHASVNADVPATWGKEMIPIVDAAHAHATWDLAAFDLAVVAPLVKSQFPELEGKLSGKGALDMSGPQPKASGNVALEKGLIYVPALGQEIDSINARAHFDEAGLLLVDDVNAHVAGGDASLSGWARIQGTNAADAEMHLVVPEKRMVPIYADGVSLGLFSGDITLKASVVQSQANGTAATLDASLSKFRFEVPEQDTSKLVDVTVDPSIYVGKKIAPGRVTFLPTGPPTKYEASDPKKLRITAKIDFGKDAFIAKGATLRVPFGGNTELVLTDKAVVDGKLTLREGGYVEVQGRRFVVDTGSVAWVKSKDAADPDVVATAYWDAPDKTRVYARFTGAVKTGAFELYSDPPRTQGEIFNLLLFGSSDVQVGSASSSSAQDSARTAATVGGAVVTKGLNQALDRATGIEIQTKISTDADQEPVPEINVPVSRSVTLGLKYDPSAPTPLSPDTETGTIDWRFLARWSLGASYGNAGTTNVDLVWRYRY
jgi:translocation and assembly module TamB